MALNPKPDIDTNEPQDALLARHGEGRIKHYVFPPDTLLFRKGDARHCAFLIDKGEVQVFGNDEGGEDKLLCSMGEGEIFGETALIDNSPRTASAITAKETSVFVIPREALHERIAGLDPIVSLLISLLIERYRVTRIHLPESIKQDSDAGDLLEKLSKIEHLPKNILRLHNSAEARAVARRELGLEQELREGLEKRQFVPALQPIMDLSKRVPVGFEALIRWQHPEKGMLFPDKFIPAAERTGLIRNLDRLMLERACELLPRLNQAFQDRSPFISVNMSGVNFTSEEIVPKIAAVLEKYQANSSQIRIEITESALIREPDVAENILKGLKNLGLSIALDDFGTGYSSLGYLHKFSIDCLKIDRSFVAQLHDGNKSVDIVRSIISLAKNFDLGTIAEGIEQEQDLAILNALDCDMAQGYFFSKPVDIDQALDFVKEYQGK